MKKLIVSAALATVVFGIGPGDARAAITNSYGYICNVTYQLQSYYMGSDGGLRVTVYSAPGCTGSYVGFGYMYSSGSPYVTSANAHTEARLLRYFDLLAEAAHNDQRVYIQTCASSSSSGCIDQVHFLAN